MIRIVLLFCTSAYVWASVPFHATDCSTSPNKIFHADNIHLSQDPILIPGNETVSVDVQILKPIAGNHYTLNLVISKKILFGWVAIPCFADLKSSVCHFELCDILSGKHYNNTHHCPVELVQSSPDLNCACPFEPGTYRINPTLLTIGHLNPALAILAQGDYKASVTVVDRNTNETVVCYQVQASTAHLGTSIIGKK